MHSMPMRPAARMWQPLKVMSWMLPFETLMVTPFQGPEPTVQSVKVMS